MLILVFMSLGARAETTGDGGESVPELKIAAIQLPHAQCLIDTETGYTLYTFTTEEGLRAYRQDSLNKAVLLDHWPRLEFHKYKMIVCN